MNRHQTGPLNPNCRTSIYIVRWMRKVWRGPGQFRGHAEPKDKLSLRAIARLTGRSPREVHDIVRTPRKRYLVE